jgi:uncharacterized cupin superfamily protein
MAAASLRPQRAFRSMDGMHHVHVPSLPWVEQRSPSGKFHSFCQNISVALGAPPNAGLTHGGHPFDLQIRRLPLGAAVCPYHLHVGQWEFFHVLAGTGTVRTPDGLAPVRTGDFFVHPPGVPHQLRNTGTVDLAVAIVADNPPVDACYYPDSDKWSLRPPGKIFRATPAGYFDGEDDGPLEAATYRPGQPSAAPVIAPFAQRKLHLDDVPWETWSSPKKNFGGSSKELSIALGAKRNTPTGLGGHPFDLELSRLAPGQRVCPFHMHSAQWELFWITAGTATVRADTARHTFTVGDVVLHPPGEAHEILNASATDPLEFLLIADNPPSEYWHYPDSGKWGFRTPRKFFRPADADYWDGEE